jgi:hypothetical protein
MVTGTKCAHRYLPACEIDPRRPAFGDSKCCRSYKRTCGASRAAGERAIAVE